MSTPLRVLVLEDRPADAELILHQLRQAGFELDWQRVESEADYLARLDESLDAILADYTLPQFDALRALRLLQERNLDIPFIIVTGSISEEVAVECMKQGVSDYLLKDRLARLGQAMAHALQEKKLRDDKRQAEAALRDSEKRFRALIEKGSDGIALVGADRTILYESPSVSRILGYASEELVGRNAFELLHPDDVQHAANRFASLVETPGASVTRQFRFRHKDGSWRWIEAVGANLLAEPSVQAIVVNYRDITERKQRERELEAIVTVATALRAAPARADMLPVILNQVLSLLKAEGAALAMRDPVSGESVVAPARGAWANMTGLRLPPGEGVSGYVIATGQPYRNNDVRSEPRFARPDLLGGLYAVACVPLIVQEQTIGALWAGRPTEIIDDELRLLAAIGDIAANALHRAEVVETLEQRVAERTRELAEANERLQELDRLKSKFVSDVSHELRTPVTNLSLYLRLLEHGKSEKRAQYLTILKQQAARLVQLIEDILNLSRLELGKTKVAFAPVDLNKVVEQVVTAHQPRAAEAGLTLTFEPGADLPPVQGELNQLAQVVTNLVANALTYTPAGQVWVRTRLVAERGQVCLQVQDTGVGIQPEDMPHLFERFYRGQRSGGSDVPGTGLGLAIIKEIVDLHAGKIEVESRVGKGSAFKVWLPLNGEKHVVEI